MTAPVTLKFGNFKIYLGDGADPETFAVPCGFTKDALKLTSTSSSTTVPDCDDPSAAAWEERSVSSLSAQVTGSGVLALGTASTAWRTWYLSALSKNIRVAFEGDADAGYYEGAAILSDFSVDGDRTANGGRVQISVTIDSDGAWEWVASV